MRQPIETVPRDGQPVILEDDANGTYELAQWSAQESGWIGENGKPCNVKASYWHAMRRAEDPEGEGKSSRPLRAGAMFPNSNGAQPRRSPESADVLDRSANSQPMKALSFDQPMSPRKAHPGQTRRRFGIACGTAMIAASLIGMYFRGDVAAYVAQHGDQQTEFGVASVPQDPPLPIEQSRKTVLAAVPILRQAEADEALASPAQVTVGRALPQTPENSHRSEVLENRLSKAEAAELQQSLQQAQDKIASLENELALLRQQNDHAQSPRRARRLHQRRPKAPNGGFFGIFNSAPNPAQLQRSTRMR
jgi:hypothetical protein